MTAEQLNKVLVGIACSDFMGDPSWKGKAQYLGYQLVRSISSYRRRFGLEVVRDSHNKTNRYRFAPSDEQLALLRNQELRPAELEPEPELDSQEKMF